MRSRATDSPPEPSLQEDDTNLGDEERTLGPKISRAARSLRSSNSHSDGVRSSSTAVNDETELQTRTSSVTTETSGFIKRKTSQLLDAVTSGSQRDDAPIAPRLAALIDSFASSDVAASIRAEIDSYANRDVNEELPDVAVESTLLSGRRGASWSTQFRILSGRAFKNLYRDPALLTSHYVSALALARKCTQPIDGLLLITHG